MPSDHDQTSRPELSGTPSPERKENEAREQDTLAPTAPFPPAGSEGQTVSPPTTSSAVFELVARAVPGYEIEKELGRGGMGVVYRARQVQANRTVALKMILAGGHADSRDLDRFRTEAEAIARLQHPGIVQVFEVGEHQGMPFFSLEFCSQGSLDDYLNGTPLPSQEAARLVQSLAEAMHAAHTAQVIHRDLKPANVLLAPRAGATATEGKRPPVSAFAAKITDFGLAKKLDEATQTQTGAVMGTPSYMAPEQAAGKSSHMGPAADVYALGAILYECLTGRPPFKAANSLDTILQVVSEEPATPSRLNPKVPRDLEIICLKCLRKEPQRRYKSALALAEDLDRYLRNLPIQARPVGASERLWRWCGRNPVVMSTISLAMVTLILAIVVGVMAFIRDRENERRMAQQKLQSQQQKLESARREREKDREALLQSLLGQAKAERLAGKRYASLASLKKAADLRKDVEVRLAATQSITQVGLKRLREKTISRLDPGVAWKTRLQDRWWIGSTRISSDGKYVAEVAPSSEGNWPPMQIQVLELPSGKQVWKNAKSLQKPIGFRPGTAQLVSHGFGALGRTSIWDPIKDREIGRFTGEKPVFNKDGSLLILLKQRHRPGEIDVRLWSLTRGRKGTLPRTGEFQGFVSNTEVLLFHKSQYRVWDCFKGKETLTLPKGLRAIGLSASTGLAAFRGRLDADAKEAVHVWDLRSGKRVLTIPQVSACPQVVDISPNGHHLAFDDPTARGEYISVWDLRLGKLSNRLPVRRSLRLLTRERLKHVIQHPGMYPLHWHFGKLRSFNQDGSLLARTALRDKRFFLCVWDVATGDVLLTLPQVEDHRWSGDGSGLVVRAIARVNPWHPDRESVSYWEVIRPVPTYHLGSAVQSLTLNRVGDRLMVNDHLCQVARGEMGPQLLSWVVLEKGIFPQFVDKDEWWALRQTSPRGLQLRTELWQLAPTRQRLVLPDDPEYAKWATRSAERYNEGTKIEEHTRWLFTFRNDRWALSPRGRLLFRAGQVRSRSWYQKDEIPGHMHLFGQTTGCQLTTTVGGPLASLGQVLIAVELVQINAFVTNSGGGGGGGVAELWDYQQGKRLVQWRHGASGFFCCFSPDGRWAAAGSPNHIRIWKVPTAAMHQEIEQGATRGLMFSPDGGHLLAIQEKRVRLFEVSTAKEVHEGWQIAEGGWNSFAISPDGKMLASGDTDGTVHLWSTSTRKELARWQGHEGAVTALLFSPDGKTLYTGSQDGSLKLWDLPFIREELKALGFAWLPQ